MERPAKVKALRHPVRGNRQFSASSERRPPALSVFWLRQRLAGDQAQNTSESFP